MIPELSTEIIQYSHLQKDPLVDWNSDYVQLNLTFNESYTIDDFSTVTNSTRYTLQHIILSSIVVTIILLAIVIGNGLVIIAIAVDQNLKGPQNWFIASLAVSD